MALACGHRADPATKYDRLQAGQCPACPNETTPCDRMGLPHRHCSCCGQGWVGQPEDRSVRVVFHGDAPAHPPTHHNREEHHMPMPSQTSTTPLQRNRTALWQAIQARGIPGLTLANVGFGSEDDEDGGPTDVTMHMATLAALLGIELEPMP